MESNNIQSTLGRGFSSSGPSNFNPYTSLLGSQAQILPWPSKQLWEMGFNTLTGLGTIDKYMREPTIFNPIFDINDIRSMEFDCGPKKRKDLDGILIGPSPLKIKEQDCTEGVSTQPPVTANQISTDYNVPSPVIAVEPSFSPGYVETGKLKRKRGRPVAHRNDTKPNDEEAQTSTPRRRGRPAKAIQSVGVKPNVFKRNQKRTASKQKQIIKAHWDNEKFDLTVDLDNHFVLVDKCFKQKPAWTKFTWFKKSLDPSVGSSLKRARLDRAMASTEWRIDWPNAIVSHLTATTSDHNPILLDSLGGKYCTKPQFKYEMMWERDPRVFWVVKRAWNEKGHQHPMVNLYRKIKHTKDSLSKWNKKQFRKLSVQINEARSTLKSIEEATHLDEMAHSKARTDLEESLRREEIFWRQKSRVTWLKDGDRSTKFFMASTVTRRRRNYIQCMKNDQGESIEDMKEIAKLFIAKFASTSKKRTKDMQYLVQKVLTRIEGWKARLLSKVGRTCLIQSVGTSIPIYVAASEVIPCGIAIHRSYNDHLSSWNPKHEKKSHIRMPEPGWWSCCTDVSIQPNQSFGAAVFRDEKDRIVTIFIERFSATNPLLAEAIIVASAAEYARLHLKGKVAFHCDNEVVVASCSTNSISNQFIDIKAAVYRFMKSVKQLEDFRIRKIDRNYNFLAHNSAKWAAAEGVTGTLDLGVMDENVFSDVNEWNPD
ncbi:hypothetical protein F8388_017443 [Cannabis sativa]|uniref:RNase H type-1 domain-containing protein n=1 Tax=Cannabis sativa TaxID=3483 RepID=A0A7J6I895_CANSA|nr:hypothetical protein F8388_017443 [Cannabis sativa]KAF4403777.1 hypothetical protein G4B88_002630 [Cannabis sativa]